MKKIIVSILAVFYLCSSTGATVHLHYCMGKLVAWDLSASDNAKCENCGMEKDGGCCKDENKFVKSSFDQKIVEPAIQLLPILVLFTPASFIDIAESHSTTIIEKYPISHAPPIISGKDILIRNCVFRN